MDHTIMEHCFGQALPEGIRNVALICTYKKLCERLREKFKSCPLPRGCTLGQSLRKVGALIGSALSESFNNSVRGDPVGSNIIKGLGVSDAVRPSDKNFG